MPSIRENVLQFPISAAYRLAFFPGFAGPVPAARMFAEGGAGPRLPSVLVNGHTGVRRVVVFSVACQQVFPVHTTAADAFIAESGMRALVHAEQRMLGRRLIFGRLVYSLLRRRPNSDR